MPAWIETEDTSNISFTAEISAEGKNNWIGLQSRNYDFIFSGKNFPNVLYLLAKKLLVLI